MKDKVEFFEIKLTSSIGHEHIQVVIGTRQQADKQAAEDSAAYGSTYEVTRLSTQTFDGIVNLCNN